MSKRHRQDHQRSTSAALAAMLSSLPDDLPPELREVFAGIAEADEDPLPPRLFREAVEQMTLPISITDTRAGILYVNRAFETMTGYSAGELIGHNQSLLSFRQTPDEVYADLWRTIGAGGIWHGRLINRRKAGDRYLVDLTIIPVKTKAGETRYFLGMHRDITVMHHLQRQVENQKALIESLIDGAPVVMALIDLDGRPLVTNTAWRQLAQSLGGQEPTARFLAALEGVIGRDLAAACREQRVLSGVEVWFERGADRSPRWFSCSGRWVRELEISVDSYFESRRQDALLLVANDITELKARYEQARLNGLRARVAEYESGLRTREIIEGALFQLNGPLNVMQAIHDMSRRHERDGPPLGAAIEEALAAGKGAGTLLRRSLPPESVGLRAPVNVNQLIRDALVTSADQLAAAGVVVDWRPEATLPAVFGPETALLLLVRILIDNALIAIGEPGATGREVRIDTRSRSEGLVELCVRDSGPGLPRAIRSRCFEPFFSAWKRARGRSGMGLALARQIVGELRGDIRIDDSDGGCAVCVYLPACNH
jgi:nitrogen fixation negative regulator NifL